MTEANALPAADLAAQIQAINTAAEAVSVAYGEALRPVIPYALRVGELLSQLKAQVRHGQWGEVKAKLAFSSRTAEAYMQLWRGRDTLLANSQSAADLTSALKLLAKPKPKPAEEEAPDRVDLPQLVETLFKSPPAVWVSPNTDGVRILTPSTQYEFYAWVDTFNTTEGYVDVATRPLTYEGLENFFGGTVWIRHDQFADVLGFVRRIIPEREPDIARIEQAGAA